MKWMLAVSLVALAGCGGSDSEDPPIIEYVSLTVDASTDAEDGEYSLTGVQACSLDSDSGLFIGTFVGSLGEQLDVRIKGFNTQGATYVCTQASGNNEGDVGQKFDNCAVELTIPDAETSTNTYAMHREDSTIKNFTYGGTCSVVVTYENNRVSGTVTCGGLVQTHLQGAARNPIDETVTADLVSESTFFCDHS